MADRNEQQDQSKSGQNASGAQGNQPKRQDSNAGEQDDVAEDRNLSGASTWLTLPDQPDDAKGRE